MVRAKNHWSGFQVPSKRIFWRSWSGAFVGSYLGVCREWLGGETVECSHMGVTAVRRGVSIGVSVIITLWRAHLWRAIKCTGLQEFKLDGMYFGSLSHLVSLIFTAFWNSSNHVSPSINWSLWMIRYQAAFIRVIATIFSSLFLNGSRDHYRIQTTRQ